MYISSSTLLIFLSTIIKFSASTGNHELIIIGAGPSGIAAATRLLENNIYNITILEAEDRIGGRVHTVRIENRIVELGAEWCHGEEDNTVFRLVNETDPNLLKHTKYPMDVLYSSNEHLEKEFKDEIVTFAHEAQDFELSDDEEKMSYGEFFLKRYEEEILKKYKDDPKKLKFAIDAISSLEGLTLTDVGAWSWLDYPAAGNYILSRGDQALVWNGVGYETILKIMLKTYPDKYDVLGFYSRLHLKKTVTTIEWKRDDARVLILCDDGTSFTADSVLFTPSLGVLKHDHHRIFQPRLPDKKVKAIEKLGFQGLMKIICHFSEKWWPGSFIFKPLIWTAEDKVNLRFEFPNAPIHNEESWVTRVSVIHYAENNPNALVSWVTGPIIAELENASDSIFQEGMKFIFKRFFGDIYNGTNPTIIHSSWHTNPNFRGTYSFETMRSRETDDNWNNILAEPLTNRQGIKVVRFAGEATHPTHYATVHGAIESGYREADEIYEGMSNIHSFYGRSSPWL